MTTIMNMTMSFLLLALLCVDFAYGLVLSGPPHVSSSPPPPPPSFAATYGTDSRLYRSYSSPSSLEHGVATWLASRNPNQSIRPFVLTTVQTASTDSSQEGDAWENAANVATVVSAFATSAATVGGGVVVKRMDEREEGRVEREKGRDEREERWRVEDRNREERWRVEDRKSQRQTALTSCTLTLLIICLFMLYFATSDSYFDYLFK